MGSAIAVFLGRDGRRDRFYEGERDCCLMKGKGGARSRFMRRRRGRRDWSEASRVGNPESAALSRDSFLIVSAQLVLLIYGSTICDTSN